MVISCSSELDDKQLEEITHDWVLIDKKSFNIDCVKAFDNHDQT